MASFDQFINSVVADGNDGKAFERFCKHFLETSPEYKDQFEKVWLWDDWPQRWSHDKGVDLIAKYKGRDKYCAIQSKCYAAYNTVPYDEVTNFLADSNRVEIEDRILMMSTNRLNEKTSKEVIQGQEKQVIIRDRQYFESLNYEYPAHISELSKAKLKERAKPRPHQAIAIDNVEKGLSNNDRGQLIMACGTGKTFATLWIKERLKANTVLVLLPSLSLLSQTMREWVWGASERFEALAVCSDQTVGKSKNVYEDISTTEVGKVTSHVEEIQKFLKQKQPKVIFSTYQSSELIQEAQKDESITSFDLVVCDEAHRCAGKSDSAFATVLHEDKIRAKKRLFTTATPRYYGKSVQSAAEGRGVEIVGMDDVYMFGPVVHKLTFGEAINYTPDPLLTDYQVVVVGVDEPLIREWIFQGEIVSAGKDHLTDARTLAAQIAVLKSIKDYDLERVISFHSNIKRAKAFAQELDQIIELIDLSKRPNGNIWSECVHGKMSAGKRRDLINGLKELNGYEIGLLTNARCLSEGVDVPSLNGVAFVDPRGSQVDIIQAVGRAIRKSDNKNIGTIVLPVFLEDGEDPESVIDASNFKPIWDVLNALRAHDETLADELDNYRINMGRGITRKSDKIEKIIFDIPRNIDHEFSNHLTTRVIERTTESWEFWYGLLLNFYEKNKHTVVPSDFEDKDGNKLGSWVSNQRSTKDQLSTEKIKKLENLEFVWDVRELQWDIFWEALQKFIATYGNTLVPQDYITPEGLNLGGLVAGRRGARTERLDDEKIRKLNSVDFIWDALSYPYTFGIELVKEFIKEYGHIQIPMRHEVPTRKFGTAKTFKLGIWTNSLRNRYAKGELPAEQVDELNQLGWIWNVQDHQDEENLKQLDQYYVTHSNLDFPYRYKSSDGYDLSLISQNFRNRREKLARSTLDRLDAVNFVWNPIEHQKQTAIKHLESYYSFHGNIDISGSEIWESFELGAWLSRQRTQYNKNKLSVKDIRILEKFNIDWEPLKTKKERGFLALDNFYNNNGHSVVPSDFITEDGFKLGGWVVRIRSRASNKDKERLKKYDFIFNTLDEKWNLGISALLLYKENFGHVLPIEKETIYLGKKNKKFPIGKWIEGLRNRYSNLDLEKKKILEKHGFVQNVFEKNWELGFTALKESVEACGHFMVPKHITFQDCRNQSFNLRNWEDRQITDDIRGKLTPERKTKLIDIGFDFQRDDNRWEEALERLRTHKELINKTSVSRSYKSPDGFNLNAWFGVQKKQFKDGTLSAEKAKKILDLGFELAPEKNKRFDFKTFKKIILDNKISSVTQYLKFRKQNDPERLPSDPRIFYTEWTNWNNILVKSEYDLRPFLTYSEAKKIVQAKAFKTISEFKKTDWKKLDLKMPSDPAISYKKDWIDWSDFLGIEVITSDFEYFTYDEAKAWITKNNVKNWPEFEQLKKAGKLSNEMPRQPAAKYAGQGWKSASDFFTSARKPNEV